MESLLRSHNREFLGPAGQHARSLAHRRLVVASTHSLALMGGPEELAFYASNLRDVIIATSDLSRLPPSLVSELRENAVFIGGRTSDIPNFNLKDQLLTVGRRMGNPTGTAGLAGETTAESANPSFFTMTSASDCMGAFFLLRPGPVPHELTVGVSCKRKGGGRLVVLGFEWADLRVSQPDAHLPAQWFKNMMEL
jgi:hypothetical protein